MRNLLLGAVALVFVGCTNSLDTSAKQGVAFCSSFASIVQKMALLRQSDNLDASDVLLINHAVSVIEPYCTSPLPGTPAQSVISALDAILIIQLSRGS